METTERMTTEKAYTVLNDLVNVYYKLEHSEVRFDQVTQALKYVRESIPAPIVEAVPDANNPEIRDIVINGRKVIAIVENGPDEDLITSPTLMAIDQALHRPWLTIDNAGEGKQVSTSQPKEQLHKTLELAQAVKELINDLAAQGIIDTTPISVEDVDDEDDSETAIGRLIMAVDKVPLYNDSVYDVLEAVCRELESACLVHPEWPTEAFHALAIIGEEYGELQQAVLNHAYSKGDWHNIQNEAIQLTAMGLRFLIHRYDYDIRRARMIDRSTQEKVGE